MPIRTLACVVALFTSICSAQLVSTSTAVSPTPATGKDAVKSPAAMARVIASMAAMGGGASQAVDFTAQGTLTIKDSAFPITIKSMGPRQLRTELQRSAGTNVLVLNNGRGQIRAPSGKVRHLQEANTLFQRASVIPALSALAEARDAATKVEELPSEMGKQGGPAARISVAPPFSMAMEAEFREKVAACTYTFDPATGFVQSIEFQSVAENDPSFQFAIKIVYADYKSVNGIQVPFTQTMYVDGNVDSALTLKSVSFNTGLSERDFALFEEVQDAR